MRKTDLLNRLFAHVNFFVSGLAASFTVLLQFQRTHCARAGGARTGHCRRWRSLLPAATGMLWASCSWRPEQWRITLRRNWHARGVGLQRPGSMAGVGTCGLTRAWLATSWQRCRLQSHSPHERTSPDRMNSRKAQIFICTSKNIPDDRKSQAASKICLQRLGSVSASQNNSPSPTAIFICNGNSTLFPGSSSSFASTAILPTNQFR